MLAGKGGAMLHKLDPWGIDDDKVRLVFDHVRNMTLAALFFAAAAWKQRQAAPFSPAVLLDYLIATALGYVGLALAWINHTNLFYKLSRMEGTRWLKYTFAALYAVILAELIRFVSRG
jgi:hypothetical protein